MRLTRFITQPLLLAAVCAICASCISNDIPYPIIEAVVTAVEVEGQTDAQGNPGGTATINKSARTVHVYVGDEVSLGSIRLRKLMFTDEATLALPVPAQSHNYEALPRQPFASPDVLAQGADTRLDCSQPVTLRLTTYQDYDWTLTVEQVVPRELVVEGQIGDAVIDDVNRNVVIYVSADEDMASLAVSEFTLGGPHGTVSPDPTATPTFDFSEPRVFSVRRAYEASPAEWTVYVYKKSGGAGESEVYPMSSRARVQGYTQSGASLVVEYRKRSEQVWHQLDDALIEVKGTRFTATLTRLAPATNYVYRVNVNGLEGDEQAFATAPAPKLTDGLFDNWHKEGRKWNPWADGAASFWDTGNQGATTVGESNSVPTDDTCNGKGQAALLESKYIVIKFAAGNIFTGEYVETDGTNGVLDFGRPFNGFPTALRVNYKFQTSTINRSADKAMEYMMGRPDSCQIYIALADWTEPYRIRTRPSDRRLFDPHDPGVIAYAQLTVGDDVPVWTRQDLVLDYYPNALGRTPKYILVVASASKYGDYFTGGDNTKLWIDNFELIYD